jgi:squalene synthase HpnC
MPAMPIDGTSSSGETVAIKPSVNGMPEAASDGEPAAEEAVERHVGVETIMARAAGENFPVALRLLPGAVRDHLRAVYGYARLVDNLGDEYPGDRHAALDWVENQLDSLFAGTPHHEVFVQLAPTVQRFGLAREPFDQLLAANRLDQHKVRYEDFDELLGYCELSANPVGHLVLAVFEASTPERIAESDDVCSGLQVLEHLQDVAEDAGRGRVYLPADDMEHFGVTADDLSAPAATASLRGLIAYEAGRARAMLDRGRPLVASLRGSARLAVAGFVAGGLANLDALQAAGFDVLGRTPKAGSARVLARLSGVLAPSLIRRRAASA